MQSEIFQLKSMLKVIKCIDQRFVFKNSVISCMALIFNLSNLRTTILHSKKHLPVAKHIKSYAVLFHRLTPAHVLVVKVSCREYGCSD